MYILKKTIEKIKNYLFTILTRMNLKSKTLSTPKTSTQDLAYKKKIKLNKHYKMLFKIQNFGNRNVSNNETHGE